MNRVKCHACGWIGSQADFVAVETDDGTTYPCPNCDNSYDYDYACCIDGCDEYAVTLNTMDGDYNWYCSKHAPHYNER